MKNRTLKILLATGLLLIGITWGGGLPLIFLPLMIAGVILTVVSLWLILSGIPKMMIVVGTAIVITGLIIAYFGDPNLDCTAMIIIGIGIIIGCIAVIVGYSDIEDITGWDRDI